MDPQQSVYEAANFFLTRSSLLAEGQRIPSSEFLFDFYKKTELFQEAIAIASPPLFESLQKGEKEKKHYLSLLKYFLRMSARATPFGLFSAVGWGEFAEKGDLSFSTASISKKVRVDMSWGQAFIDHIHSHKGIVRCLKVMPNPNLIKKAGRILLSKDGDSLSIKSSVVSDFIFEQSKTPLIYSDLEAQLLTRFSEHSEEVVSDYLWQVFQKGYLLSECSISLNRPFSLKEFCNMLKGKDALDLSFFETLSSLVENYEKANVGKGLPILEELVTCLNQWKKVRYPLQIDAYRKTGAFSLPSCIQKTIEETASILWLLSNEETNTVSHYYQQFHEKYGDSRLVPLLELIDPHQGLGMLKPKVPDDNKPPSFPWQQLLLSSIQNNEIRIEHLPQNAISQEKLQNAPSSLEIAFELLASSQEDLNAGNYTLVVNPLVTTRQAGTIFGRFLYLFDSSQTDQLRQLIKQEEDLYPQVLFVEAGFSPSHSRVANIAFHENIREFHLQMHFHEPSDKTLDLEDIYVGSRKNRLYLYSKKMKKELHVVLSSAVNKELAPPALKFLLDLSQERFTSFNPFIWGKMPPCTFLPRVSYKNVILSPARWLLTSSDLKLTEKSSQSDIEKAIKDAFVTLKIPNEVYLTHFDNRLLIDWKNQDHFSLILQHFARKKEILFFEYIERKQESLVRSDKGGHVTEFVVPCIKKSAYKSKEYHSYYPPTEQINPLDRLSLPGGDWLFIKLFVAKEDEESFLQAKISPFIQHLLDNHLIDKWFYVRYHDEKPHIRFRLHGQPEQLYGTVLPLIHTCFSEWITSGHLAHFGFYTYEKEIERYGGPDAILLAEEIFCADSLICLSLLRNKENLKLPLHALGAIGIMNFLKGFYPTIDEQLGCFSSFSEKRLLSGFREHTQKALEITLNLLYTNESPPSEGFLPIWKEQLHELQMLTQRFERLVSTNKWNQKHSIVHSIVHMHCNRLFGINPEKEKEAIAIAMHLLEKVNHKLQRQILCFK